MMCNGNGGLYYESELTETWAHYQVTVIALLKKLSI